MTSSIICHGTPVIGARTLDATVSIATEDQATLTPPADAKWAWVSVLGVGTDNIYLTTETDAFGVDGIGFGGGEKIGLKVRLQNPTSGNLGLQNAESGTIVVGVFYTFDE